MHTPGPWRVGMRNGANGNGVYAYDGEDWSYDTNICAVMGLWSNTPTKDLPECAGLANAHLIAAAPDMLHRLNYVQEDLNTAIDHYDMWTKRKMLQHLMGVQHIVGEDIRKAKGEG